MYPLPAISFLYYTKVNFLVKLHMAINNPLLKLQGVIYCIFTVRRILNGGLRIHE